MFQLTCFIPRSLGHNIIRLYTNLMHSTTVCIHTYPLTYIYGDVYSCYFLLVQVYEIEVEMGDSKFKIYRRLAL